MDYSLDLLNSITNDMYMMLSLINSPGIPPLSKMSPFIKNMNFFSTIAKSIGPKKIIESSIQDTNIGTMSGSNVLLLFFTCLKEVHEVFQNMEWVSKSHKVILELVMAFRNDGVSFTPFYTKVLDYLVSVHSSSSCTLSKLKSILMIQKDILTNIVGYLPVTTAQRFTHENILRLRHFNDPFFARILIDIFKYLLSTNQADIVSFISNVFIEDFNTSLKTLERSQTFNKDIIISNVVFDMLIFQEALNQPTIQQNILDIILQEFNSSLQSNLFKDTLIELTACKLFSLASSKANFGIISLSNQATLMAFMKQKLVFYSKKTLLATITESLSIKENGELSDDFLIYFLRFAHDRSDEIRLTTSSILEVLFEKRLLNYRQMSKVANVIFQRRQDSSKDVRINYQKLFSYFGPLIRVYDEQSWKSLVFSSMNLTYTESKSIYDLVTDFIQNKRDNIWKHVIGDFFSAQVLTNVGHSFISKRFGNMNIEQQQFIEENVNINEEIAIFSSLIHSALYIVNNKLRAPPKNPNDTLYHIENMICEISSQYSASLKKSSELRTNSKKDKRNTQSAPIYITAKYCLDFIDILEKLLYNVCEYSFTLPNIINPTVTSFFTGNKKSCFDWLASMRSKIMISSAVANSPYDTVRHAMERLSSFQKYTASTNKTEHVKKEFEASLLILTTALSDIKDTDTLEGLFQWLNSLPTHLQLETPFLLPLIYEASGSYENAFESYKKMLNVDDDTKPNEFVLNRITSCLAKLGDWEESRQWIEKYGSYFQEVSPMTYLKGLIAYEDGKMLETVDILSRLGMNSEIDWIDPQMNLLICEALQLEIMALSKLETKQKHLVSKITESKRLALEPLLSSSPPHQQSKKFLAQLYNLKFIEDSIVSGKSPEGIVLTGLDPLTQEVGTWNNLLRVVRYCDSNSQLITEMTSHLAKLARKHHNIRLAERLISKFNLDSYECLLERSKLLYSQAKRKEAIDLLWSVYANSQSNESTIQENEECIILSRMYLKLSDWLCQAKHDKDMSFPFPQSKYAHNVDQILSVATSLDNTNAKSWLHYADWAYKKGSKQSRLLQENVKEVLPLFVVEDLKNLMNDSGYLDLTDSLIKSVFVNVLEGLEEFIEGPTLKETIEKSIFKIIGDNNITENIVSIWKSARKALLEPYKSSLISYFKFLKEKSCSGQSIAPLRLLRLIVKYGNDFQTTITEELAQTPTIAWIDIVPQILARLGHPEPFVRGEILRLLTRIGTDHPNVILYPSVVGAMGDSQEDQESSEEQEIYKSLKASLFEDNADLVTEVESLIHEFRRIAILLKENAYISMKDVQTKISTSIHTLEDEISRIQDCPTPQEKKKLLYEKYVTIMKPPLVRLERFLSSLPKSPATENERDFYIKHLGPIHELRDLLKSPLFDEQSDDLLIDLVDSKSKEIVKMLSKKRSTLDLKELSPKLFYLSSSNIPLPGISGQEKVTIQRFENTVDILMTKNKPKRVVMMGSDGKKYSYLLKAHEDMHLDERIMQFLSIVNQLLSKDKSTSARKLSARHYSVIPIGTNSGLIQWVDGAIPLYSLFTEWVQRNSKSKAIASTKMIKPVDLYYDKIFPLAKELGINNVTSRSEWPADVQKNVFRCLVEEMPNNLLEKELWCSSPTTESWWHKITRYSRSNAVMSMVGYIIGLGDRHLDNILIDFESGEVVHIDYNICFEKGLKLRVPEVVPFRLTQNMVQALGFAGVEGSFRIASEHTLRVLRENRETLLTLLEAFVYDPLVDWTADKTIIEERVLELKIILSLFISRMDDTKLLLSQNQKKLASNLPNLLNLCSIIINGKSKYRDLTNAMKERQSKKTQLENLLIKSNLDIENEGNTLKSLDVEMNDKKKKLMNIKSTMISDLERNAQAFEKAHKGFNEAIATDIETLVHIEYTKSSIEDLDLSSLSVQERFSRKCKEKDKEMTSLLSQRDAVMKKVSEYIKTYMAFVTQLSNTQFTDILFYQWIESVTALSKACTESTISSVLDILNEEKSKHYVEEKKQIEKNILSIVRTCTDITNELNIKLNTIETERTFIESLFLTLKQQIATLLTNENQKGENEGSNYLQNCALKNLADMIINLKELAQKTTDLDPEVLTQDVMSTMDNVSLLIQLITDAWYSDSTSRQELNAMKNIRKIISNMSLSSKTYTSLIQDTVELRKDKLTVLMKNVKKLEQRYTNPQFVLTTPQQYTNELDAGTTFLNSTIQYAKESGNTTYIHIIELLDNLSNQIIEFVYTNDTLMASHANIIKYNLLKMKSHCLVEALKAMMEKNIPSSSEAILLYLIQNVFVPFVVIYLTEYITSLSSRDILDSSSSLKNEKLIQWIDQKSPNTLLRNSFSELINTYLENQERMRSIQPEKTKLLQALNKNEIELQNSQIALAEFQWRFEHILTKDDDSETPAIKSKLMTDIQNSLQALEHLDQAVCLCDETYSSNETSIVKSFLSALKIQPNLKVAYNEFLNNVESRKNSLAKSSATVKNIVSIGKMIVQYENYYMMDNNSLTMKNLVLSYIDIQKEVESMEHKIAESNNHLVKLKMVPDTVKSQLDLLKTEIELDQSVLKKMKDDFSYSKEDVKMPILAISEVLESPVFSELISIVHSIVRYTETWDYFREIQTLSRELYKYLKNLQKKIDRLTKIISFVSLKVNIPTQSDSSVTAADLDIDSIDPNTIVDSFRVIDSYLNKLFVISTEWIQQHEELENSNYNIKLSQDAGTSSFTPMCIPVQRTKNTIALNILKRVKQKLDGTDSTFMTQTASNASKKLKIAEHVAQLIKSATDEENLYRLYEGWTAWI